MAQIDCVIAAKRLEVPVRSMQLPSKPASESPDCVKLDWHGHPIGIRWGIPLA